MRDDLFEKHCWAEIDLDAVRSPSSTAPGID